MAIPRTSFLTLRKKGEAIGTLRIYELDSNLEVLELKSPMEFEYGTRGIKLLASESIKSWLVQKRKVFELGRFSIRKDASPQERDAFFSFIDLVMNNLSRLYPDAQFICDVENSSFYRLYKMRWGFEILESVSTPLGSELILTVTATTINAKSESSLKNALK